MHCSTFTPHAGFCTRLILQVYAPCRLGTRLLLHIYAPCFLGTRLILFKYSCLFASCQIRTAPGAPSLQKAAPGNALCRTLPGAALAILGYGSRLLVYLFIIGKEFQIAIYAFYIIAGVVQLSGAVPLSAPYFKRHEWRARNAHVGRAFYDI